MTQKERKIKIQPVKSLKLLLAGILLGAVLLGGGYWLGKTAPSVVQSAEEMEAVLVESQVLAAGELVTAHYMYTELGQYANSKEFYGAKIPFTTSKFMVAYDGVIKAGIDLEGVSVKADSLTKTVTIAVPQAGIISHDMDKDSVQIYDEKHSVFNKLTLEDYTQFFADQEASVEAKAREKGLLAEAQEEAVSQLRNLLQPVIDVAGGGEWTLEFKLARQ